jgi:hypothetical protein
MSLYSRAPVLIFLAESKPMRPKASGLAHHGGPPSWLEESDPPGVILYRLSFPYRTGCLDRSCPAASRWNFQLMLYKKYAQPSVIELLHTMKAWRGTLVDPCLLSGEKKSSNVLMLHMPIKSENDSLARFTIHRRDLL